MEQSDRTPADLMQSRGLEPQREAVERARRVVAADERIMAAWVVGSLATGEADAYSDVDLQCLIVDESADWYRQHWRELVTKIVGSLVLAESLPGLIGGYTMTPDWLHVDLVLHRQSDLDPKRLTGIMPLYDRTGDLLPTHTVPVTRRGEPYFPDHDVKLFLYYLGNLPVGMGRGELVHLHGGTVTWREVLIQVMLAENGIRDRGGKKRLNPFVTRDQREFLESIPAAGPQAPEILRTLHVISAEIIRRGKRLAAATGAAWPQSLEDAAKANIRRHLGDVFVL